MRSHGSGTARRSPTTRPQGGVASLRLVLALALGTAVAAAPATAQRAPQSASRLPLPELPALQVHGDASVLGASQPQPRRQTLRGLRIGAITGALVGAGTGTLMALWCAGTSDGCIAAIPIVTVLGAASGAAAGAIIGAAIPTEAGRAEPSQPAPPVPAPGRRIGSFSMSVGDAQARISDEGEQSAFDGGGIAFRASLQAELRPWLALGPDLGVAAFGDGGTIRHAAVGVRGTWPVHPAFTPYISANAGVYDSSGPSLEYLGGGLGIGFRVTPVRDSRAFLDLEARSSRNLQNIAPMRMRTLSVGGGIYW
jgi:hypothetical protein